MGDGRVGQEATTTPAPRSAGLTCRSLSSRGVGRPRLYVGKYAILAALTPAERRTAMPATTLSPEKFREEARRRLIDRFELQKLLDIRSRGAIPKMIEDGRLPEPVVHKTGASPLWDLDEVEARPDRKE
jgi:hypothetical protein